MNILPNIPKDKQGHFIIGGGLSLASGWYSVYLAIFLVALFGIGKEVYDYKHPKKHTAEVLDAVATFLGGIAGYLPYLIIGLI
tara:strand:+ start:298 stop:546 length:249 start_codon:yes stop_codon:yes gene_type:complete